VYFVLLAYAYRTAELSVVYPVARGLAPVRCLAAGMISFAVYVRVPIFRAVLISFYDGDGLGQWWGAGLQDWGGAEAFAEQWNATRRLRPRFVEVDLLQAPETALGTPSDGPSLVWWSNAFSSVHALWHLRHAERLHAFSRWIEVIAERCPQAWLLGADANNCPVGGIQAAAYANLLSAWQGGLHEPLPPSPTAIRTRGRVPPARIRCFGR